MKYIASLLGVGYIRKGGGTVAAALAVAIWYLALHDSNGLLWPSVWVAGCFVLGVWSGNVVEKDWGKDSYRVVIDEVAGMFLSLWALPFEWPWMLAAFVLFRFFDIAKPFYIRRMEALKGGWGVMMDDMLAGLYANVLLQLVALFLAS